MKTKRYVLRELKTRCRAPCAAVAVAATMAFINAPDANAFLADLGNLMRSVSYDANTLASLVGEGLARHWPAEDNGAAMTDADPARPVALEDVTNLTESILAEGLIAPDGLAIHPVSGDVYVSEEDASRISTIIDGRPEMVIDATTPVYTDAAHHKSTQGLSGPEGIAFGPDGSLYVVEDRPGGRLISYTFGTSRKARYGEVIELAGSLGKFAWEGVDVNARGEILVAGSDVESVVAGKAASLFTGVIIFRDAQGAWWVPYQRTLASFSSVRFCPDGKRAVYACELSGEAGWFDLTDHSTQLGYVDASIKGIEGMAVLPNGMLLIAKEAGTLYCVNPLDNVATEVVSGLGHIESVEWDAKNQQILVSEDSTGRILSFTMKSSVTWPSRASLIVDAPVEPPATRKHVPVSCPDFLKKTLKTALAAAGVQSEMDTPFAQFADKLPLIAIDAIAIPVTNAAASDDPIERITFAVFQPNTVVQGGGAVSPSISSFVAQRKSGQVLTTKRWNVVASRFNFDTYKHDRIGNGTLTYPQVGPISVSAEGITTVVFLGLFQMPDIAITLNPDHPEESYMAVMPNDGPIEEYKLSSGSAGSFGDQWVNSYSKPLAMDWAYLGSDLKPDVQLASLDTMTRIP